MGHTTIDRLRLRVAATLIGHAVDHAMRRGRAHRLAAGVLARAARVILPAWHAVSVPRGTP